jgi:dTDP-4-amino-4,6-dideoxygalactose transaminase
VARFEEHFATYVGARYCIGVESGTGALKLALQALGIGPGDEVIIPVNTFIASALAVSAVGARPVLVEADDAYLIDSGSLEAALTPRTKAIMPVHLYGQAVPMDAIETFARRHGLRVVEDASQAHGARWRGRRVGSFGDAGCFSFYPSKNLGAYGDAGAILTSDPELADRLRLLRDLGQPKKYEHIVKGDNCRLDALQAAVLDAKLPYLDGWNDARRRHADAYDAKLSEIGITPPKRDRVQAILGERGIATAVHYPIPIHLQTAYADLGLGRGSFERTERSANRVLSLPMFAELSDEQIDLVVDALASSKALAVSSA